MTNGTGRRGIIAGLLWASFLSLFVELTLIRWIPSTLHVVAFFSNLVLIACFLGLGIGMTKPAEAAQAVLRAYKRLSVTVLVLAVMSVLNPGVSFGQQSDYAVNEVAGQQAIVLPLLLVMVFVFALAAWTCIPFGQLVATYFDRIGRLQAYSVNIAGSLLGVLGFAAISALALPPWVWFAVCLLILFVIGRTPSVVPASILILGVMGALHVKDSGQFHDVVGWSPYYKVVASSVIPQSRDLSVGFTVNVNNQFLLSGFDLRPDAQQPPGIDPEVGRNVELLKTYYDFPFELKPSARVLILGSGAGNDVAAALRHSAESVTAVEIDPLVLELGQRFHPEQPYSSPKVTVVCNDARRFLNTTSERYDLVVFATLDAHGLLSGASNVRLDSFIYTRESFEAVKRHLTPDGIMVLSFGPFREDVQLRQYSTVREVFGQEPLFVVHENHHRSIVAGALQPGMAANLPSTWRLIDPSETEAKLAAHPEARDPPTDDWPQLYMREHRIPREYLGVLIAIALVSLVALLRSFRGVTSLDGHFFFLGAGFLLLETKSVTEFALLMGSTWQVSALVFSIILGMILLANLLCATVLRRVPVAPCYALLLLSLCAGYLWPASTWAQHSGLQAYMLIGAFLGLPILMAGIIFASTFRATENGAICLASNLCGAVLGGIAEYGSLILGIRALSLIALAMYVLSGLILWRRSARTRLRTAGVPSTG